MKYLIGLFIIAHGLIYGLYFIPQPPDSKGKWPFVFQNSWLENLLGSQADTVGTVLAITAIAAFLLGGIGLLFVPSMNFWRYSLIVAAVVALILQVIFWQNQLVIGLLINAAIIYWLTVSKWTIQ